MKLIKSTLCTLLFCLCGINQVTAQIDKDQLALDIYKADDANTQKLKEFIWKRKSDVSSEGVIKLTTITEFSFDETGKLQAKTIDAQSTVDKKPGLRGKAQENAMEAKKDYIQKALELSVAYTFMTKGQLLDFFGKATVSEKDGVIEASADDVNVKGDHLTIWIDAATKLFIKKQFKSSLGTDIVDGEINYEKFSTGVNHGSTTILNMPAQKMKIDAKNQDYTIRVK
jgi:hypothetical protein